MADEPIYMQHPDHRKDEPPIQAVNEDQAAVFESVGWERVDADKATGRPADSASKAKWVAFAVAQGADEQAAQDMTRDQLVETFGG